MKRLRLARHRVTTAHAASAYPFLAAPPLGEVGPWLGVDVLAGGAPFAFDPFDAYAAGLVTNPNMLIAGEPGVGKSATVKTFVHRAVGVFGRWVAIADPKGEYGPLADSLGLDVIRLCPGGDVRLNPLDASPDASADEVARSQATMVGALVGAVLRRDLEPLEDAAVGWATGLLARGGTRMTLADLARLLATPTAELAEASGVGATELARRVEAVTFALGKLLDRNLRGMFDGTTTVSLRDDGPGVVVDLSAVHHDPEALSVVMVATTAWLQTALARPGPPKLQILDEAWSLLASERTTRYLQSCWKLGRSYGVANVAVVHRLSDLRAQADDGTATAKVAAGLLADTQTRVLFRQSPDQIPDARALLGLTEAEAAVLPRLARGRALWRLGSRPAIVQHVLGPAERALADTDARMAS